MKRCLALLLACGLAQAASAQTPAFPSVADAVSALGSKSFAVREKASAFLYAAGRLAEPALEKAQHGKDPEQASRARAILEKFQWGIYPDTPKDLLKAIDGFRAAPNAAEKTTAFKSILGRRPGGAAIAARIIRRAAGAEAELDEGMQAAIMEAVPDLLWHKELDALENLLEARLVLKRDEARRDYAAILLLRGRVQEQIPQWRAKVERPDGAEAAHLLTYLYRSVGDAKNLRWAVEKANDPALLENLLHEQADWSELAARYDKLTNRNRTLALLLSYQRLAGQTKEFEATLADIVKEGLALPEGDDAVWNHVKPLLSCARTKEALELLQHGHRYSFAYDLLCQQMRFGEAFQLADKLRGKPKFDLQLARARTLQQLSKEKEAREIVKEYARLWKPPSAEEERGAENYTYRDFIDLPVGEYKMGLHADALAHAGQLIERYPGQGADIAEAVFQSEDGRPGLWWKLLRRHHPKDGLAKSLERLHALNQKRMPAPEFEALVRAGIAWVKEFKIATPGATFPPYGVLDSKLERGDLEPIATVCQDMKQDELARLCLETAAEGTQRWLPLGNYLLKKKRWSEAAAVFAKACDKQKDAPEAFFLRGWALVQAGKEEEGRRWMELAHWLPLGRDDGRKALAVALDQFDLGEQAARELAFIRRLGRGDFDAWHSALRDAARLALREKKFDEAVTLADRCDLAVLSERAFYVDDKNWIAKPHQVLVMRAQAQIQAGQFEAARRTIRIAAELMPGNVELPLACVPALEKKGQGKAADALFGEFFERYQKLCTDYPRCAEFHNAQAWEAACCRRQLGPALEHATKAVQLAPKTAGYLDTLAEVHFQRGDYNRALEVIAEAITLDPQYDYFRKQRQRFAAGDRLAPIPED